jgi:chromosome segregation ATPase
MESITQNVESTESSLDGQLDSISLEQALLDFERANARVIDLTQRLLEASDELLELKESLRVAEETLQAAEENLRAARDELEALRYENDMIKSSGPFQLLVFLRKLTGSFRR